jgi:ATP adenylyltransferase/5',5'''-P-1,P-4-tetraphosphate phosphorylase II
MLKEAVKALFEEQLSTWELAKKNYAALSRMKMKTFEIAHCEYRVQFNPERITSSSAKVDVPSIRERKCFLCLNHLPPEQKGISFNDRYTILVNPYPIFPQHLTIPEISHTPQRILPHLEDMFDLSKQLDDYILFYNGPGCGASAPDHFHFQAGNKGFLPVEKDRAIRCPHVIESDDKKEAVKRFHEIYRSLELKPGEDEPMINVLTWFDRGYWIVCVFPRKKHRPSCYFAEGNENLLISPASVDMGGVLVVPLEKDFRKITAKEIKTILQEVCG